jgi:hypothetical protein
MQIEVPPRQTERLPAGTQPRSRLGGWIRRGLLGMIVGILALATIGAV